MAAPTLRRYTQNLFPTVGTPVNILAAAVPAGRALVVSKITVANITAASITFGLQINGGYLAYGVPLGPGEVYAESGIVVLAGEQIQGSLSAVNAAHICVFGEEVDN